MIDERVRAAAVRWQLTVGERLAGGTRSAVYAASDPAGRDLVLKVPEARSFGSDLAVVEASALRTWAPTGAAVDLVAASTDALLLARARPGELLPWSPTDVDDVVEVAGALLERLWSVPSGHYGYPSLKDVYPHDERVAREDAAHEQEQRGDPDRGRPGLRLLPAAAVVAESLITTSSVAVLLHGDFITKNVVSDAASPVGWVALDPLPMIGDPAAEIAAFAAYQPAELIFPIAELLAVRVGMDTARVLRWAAIWTVHQTAQAWREDQLPLEDLVSSVAVRKLLNSTGP